MNRWKKVRKGDRMSWICQENRKGIGYVGYERKLKREKGTGYATSRVGRCGGVL